MSLFSRLFLAFVLLLGASAALMLWTAVDEIKPAMRQSAEDALVDTANLLAELTGDKLDPDTLASGPLADALAAYIQRELDAGIWGHQRSVPNYRVYVTNASGIVVYDSSGEALGEDYSQWRDVWLTLRGQYGARTTLVKGGKKEETVMYVAAPIKRGADIIGSLTVAKPNLGIQPLIHRSERKLLLAGSGVLLGALLVAWLAAWGHSRSVNSLVRYADSVSDGHSAELPRYSAPELRQLAQSVDSMRETLEGKAYVEQYAEVLTHELKSPVTAILAAEELLREPLSDADRTRFLDNIHGEAERMQQVLERLLELAVVEHRRQLQDAGPVAMARLIRTCIESRQAVCERNGVHIRFDCDEDYQAYGETFLLSQAIGNLMDNALDFSARDDEITVMLESQNGQVSVKIRDQGPGVPDYALERVSERFYSLPRPRSGKKSSGLGLSFVSRVANLHGGYFSLENIGDQGKGAVACLQLPAYSAV